MINQCEVVVFLSYNCKYMGILKKGMFLIVYDQIFVLEELFIDRVIRYKHQ